VIRPNRVASAGVLVALLGLVAFSVAAETITLPQAVPSFNQTYADGTDAWGTASLGSDGCPDHIAETGCLVTAFACVLDYFDIRLTVTASQSSTGRARSGMDPGILNDWLRSHGGFAPCSQDPVGSCCLVWEAVPGVGLAHHSNRSDVGLNAVSAVVIDHALRQGNPVIAGVHWMDSCNGGSQSEDCHWIVLTGKTGSTYTILDPYNPDTGSKSGVRTTLEYGSFGSYTIDRFTVIRATGEPLISGPHDGEDGSTGTFDLDTSPFAILAVLALAAAIVLAIVSLGNR